VTVEAVAQVVHETTAIVVVIAMIAMIAMIAASAPRAQIVRLEPSEHPAKTYHQSTRPP
jgi:sensor histidine kinase regulating citrate/malate metabolism